MIFIFCLFSRARSSLSPASVFLALIAASLFFGLVGRLIFLAASTEVVFWGGLSASFLRGVGFDLIACFYLSLPFVPLLILSRANFARPAAKSAAFVLFMGEMFLLTLCAVSEMFFIEEFRSRFNFIAVDYLVYTNEVLKNIWESYPMWLILPLVALGALLFSLIALRLGQLLQAKFRIRNAALILIFITSAFFISFAVPRELKLLEGLPSLETEVSKNGIHALFAAYFANEIDYSSFYAFNGKNESQHIVHEHMELDYGLGGLIDQLGIEDEGSIARNIESSLSEKRLNVVLVLMESMSATFMKTYGSKKDITPNLDMLAREGLLFDRLYATGTRTVRGIEAVLLSIPPTPGQSIVRRPDAGELFSMGTVFRARGYATDFLYGGRSYFDNMKDFFQGNHFEVEDQTSIPERNISFSNAWGVADEDLFRHALGRQVERFKEGKPFFQFILTTSNHRPYTFPSGRIDLPSPSGRDGAVKYADFAIGDFIAKSRKMPWFKDTVYIFVADHNASVAGGTKVLPADYRIPAVFYSPAHIKPAVNSLLSSQIDIGPTLFGLLNFSYQSRFFGHDLTQARTERAFIGTYQRVGLWQQDKLVILSPNFNIEVAEVEGEQLKNSKQLSSSRIPPADQEVSTSIAYYETASAWFKEKLLKESQAHSRMTNIRTF